MGIIVEPYVLAQFMPAVVVSITARVGKHAILCASRRTKERWSSHAERSLAQDGGEVKQVCALGFAREVASRVL
jgi:hypothetical protein